MSNPYCERLGIPAPSLFDVGLGHWTNYLDVIVLVLLERGAPLSLDEIVHSVLPLWSGGPESLRTTLQKAWAGREPVVKDAAGRLALDLESWRLRPVLERLGLVAPKIPPRSPEFHLPPPDSPLTRAETDAAFQNCVPASISGVRLAAAILDVHDRPMTPEEILAAIPATPLYRPSPPRESPRRPTPGLVLKQEDGRLVLNRSSPDLAAMRSKIRSLAFVTLRRQAEVEHIQRLLAARDQEEAARAAAREKEARNAARKLPWSGVVVSVQPRIRLTRSFDQRSHSYLGYTLRLQGSLDGEVREFVVAVGKGAHDTHQFRVGDEVKGVGVRVQDPDLETADLYKVSGIDVGERGPAERSAAPPYAGVPPVLDEYRERGHRRLAALTYAAKCTSCLWGCEMAVEMIIDQWNPSRRKHRRETFCYGPKSCPHYAAGPTRKVPGRKGMTWEEEDWVDEDATAHRGEDE